MLKKATSALPKIFNTLQVHLQTEQQGCFLLTFVVKIKIVDKTGHIAYWLSSAAEDDKSADILFHGGQFMYSLFTCHLMLEKACKAHWVRSNDSNFPPRTHHLNQIIQQTDLIVPEEYLEELSVMNAWNIEGRYPDFLHAFRSKCTFSYTKSRIEKAKEIYQWLLKQMQ